MAAASAPTTTNIPDVPDNLKQVAAASAISTRATVPNTRTGLKHQILETREDIFA